MGPRAARGEKVTVEAVLRAAQERHPAVLAAAARVEQARGARIAAGYLLPTNPEIEAVFETDAPFEAEGEGAWEVALSQELEIFGQRGLRQEVAAHEVRAAELGLAAARLAARREALGAYFDLLYQERLAAVYDELVAQGEKLLEAARRRLGVGDIPEAEVTLVAADLAEIAAEAGESRAEWARARARLNAILGRAAGDPVETDGDFPAPAPAPPLDVLLRGARERHPELRAAAREIDARDREIRLAHRARLPNPKVGLAIAREDTVLGADDVIPPGVLSRAHDRDLFVGVRLDIPLPLFRTGRAEIVSARGRRDEAEARRETLARRIDETVASVLARYEAAREAVGRYVALEAELEGTRASYERAHAAGQLGVADYLAIRDRVLRVRLGALRARREAAIAAAELEAVSGGVFRLVGPR